MSFIKQKMTTFLSQADQKALSDYLETLPAGQVSNVTGLLMHLFDKAQTNGQTQSEGVDLKEYNRMKSDLADYQKGYGEEVQKTAGLTRTIERLEARLENFKKTKSDKPSDTGKQPVKPKETPKPQKTTQTIENTKSDKNSYSGKLWFE